MEYHPRGKIFCAGLRVGRERKMQRQAESIEEFRDLVKDGYYLAEAYNMSAVPRAHYGLETALAGAIPISRFRGTSVGVRRTWHHIREQTSGLYVLWYPLAGDVAITQDTTYDMIVKPGELIITCGDRPFHARSSTSDGADSAMMHVLVPAHIMRSHIPHIDRICGKVSDASSGTARIARGMFTALLEEESKISAESAQRLSIEALEILAETLRQELVADPVQVDAKQAHLARALRFIDQRLSTQGLTADNVARACNISRRYLHYLLSGNNNTFGGYLWERRLMQAKEWLNDPEFRHFHIVDIAYMCGFRSGSHFSNSYRSRFGYSPTEERSERIY